MRDDKAFIKVEVTEQNGDKTYGTAYRINREHAITALHVINDQQPKKFIFPCGTEGNDFDEVFACDDSDVAIIKFPEAIIDTLPSIKRAEFGQTSSNAKWSGAGYPKFAEDNNKCRTMEQVQGDAYHCQEGDSFFDLECRKLVVRVEKINQWGGISGAPVFVDDKLVAVISKFDPSTENTHFRASAIWALVGNDDFKDCITQTDIDQQIKRNTQQWLESDPDVKNALGSNGKDAQGIIEKLANFELPDLLEHLESEKDEFNEQAEKNQYISQFIRRFLPYYFANHAVIIDESLITHETKAIDINCVTEVAAECCIAAFTKRPVNIDKKAGEMEGEEELQVTKNKFALAPEMGIDQEGREIEEVTTDILRSNALDIDTVLEKKFGKANPIIPTETANIVLAGHKKRGRRYYLVLRMYPGQSDYENKVERVASYRKKFPDLIIVNLSRDPDIAKKEVSDLVEPLPYVL